MKVHSFYITTGMQLIDQLYLVTRIKALIETSSLITSSHNQTVLLEAKDHLLMVLIASNEWLPGDPHCDLEQEFLTHNILVRICYQTKQPVMLMKLKNRLMQVVS